MRSLKYLLTIVALTGVLFTGCAKDAKEAKKPVGTDSAGDHGHDDHGHVHGPHGGEVFEIEGQDFKIECAAKYGQNLVMFYIYEDDLKTSRKIKCEELTGSYSAGEVKSVSIPAMDAEEGMASRFEIQDEGFAIARKTTGVKLEFEVDGNKISLDLPKDPHG